MTLIGSPSHEHFRFGQDIIIPAGTAAILRGTGIAVAPTLPATNQTATNGYFGNVATDIPANTSAVSITVRVLATTMGIDEVLLSAAVVAGAPLTLDATNRYRTAVAAEKIYARAIKAGVANALVQAFIRLEGTF